MLAAVVLLLVGVPGCGRQPVRFRVRGSGVRGSRCRVWRCELGSWAWCVVSFLLFFFFFLGGGGGGLGSGLRVEGWAFGFRGADRSTTLARTR